MTMTRRISLLLVLAMSVAIVPGLLSGEEDAVRIHRANRLLEEELALAKAPNFYFMFNLAEKTISLKSKGVVLRSWAPRKIRFWGKPLEFRALTLSRKTAFSPPKRKVIKPGESETVPTPDKPGGFELEALEVKDMPLSYTLELEDGTKIEVSPRKKGISGLMDEFHWSIGLPLTALKLSLRKRSIQVIGISFDDPKEGQSLYWVMTEGLRGLVWLSSDK